MEQKTEEVKEVKEVKKSDTIQAIFDKYPGKAQKLSSLMTNAGLHCVGCDAAVWETLEQGVMGHGMSQEILDKLVVDINETINSKEEETALGMTEVACEKIKELLKKEGKDNWGLQINLAEGGCSGFMYEFALKEKASDTEETFETKGVKVFITKNHLDKMQGSEIDYVDGIQGAGFKVNNPNVVKSCGCGSSMGF